MRVRIDPDLCAACGPCEDICPEVFRIEDDTAVVLMEQVPPEYEDAVREAAEACPPEAIIIEED